MVVFNETGGFLGYVHDEDALREFEYEFHGTYIIVLDTNQTADEYIKLYICHSN